MKLLLTEPEAMEQLSISRSTLIRLVKGGHINSVKIGSSVRCLQVELERFVNELQAGAVNDNPED